MAVSRRTIAPGIAAAGMLCASLSVVAAQGSAPAAERVKVVSPTLKGEPSTGPFKVVVEHDQTLATHTIYRPATLTLPKHPVVIWGEGGCAKDGLQFPEFL